jgi:putative phosphoesterase
LLEDFRHLEAASVGVLADTHLPYRMQHLPEKIFEIFSNVDIILHAGDVDRIDCLHNLAVLAPLYAVRGNFHFTDGSDGGRDLPAELRFTIAGHQIALTHGGWPHVWSQASDWFLEIVYGRSKNVLNQRMANRLARLYSRADAIIFGHSHRPYQAWHNGTLIFNPGAVCPTAGRTPSIGRLYLGPDSIKAEVIPLV